MLPHHFEPTRHTIYLHTNLSHYRTPAHLPLSNNCTREYFTTTTNSISFCLMMHRVLSFWAASAIAVPSSWMSESISRLSMSHVCFIEKILAKSRTRESISTIG
ncbi:hypothetical protein BpHYR1_014290 [Brachionus plicatilis]|uniref:Uncharacterized protein n=1 Tax=Brachionus plicatilis TaxID=10195 RepID=A0A3M7R6I5_BRAPC|nr:hypothetical protein BpHYR1_014290 [Brachionus plicatilis]